MTELKGETDSSTIVVTNTENPHSVIEQLERK